VHPAGGVPATDTSPEPDEPLTAILHLVLAQTAFLLYEGGNSQAAALLADVEDIEHFPSDRSEEGEDVALIVPLYLVARFTQEVLGTIQPLLVHVAARHDLLVDNVTAIPALPETGDDWRQLCLCPLQRLVDEHALAGVEGEAVPAEGGGCLLGTRRGVLAGG
jgi:hypothetical protein